MSCPPSAPWSPNPTQLKSISRHALARYREHFPDADPNQALAEAMLAHPIDATLAHTLAGRVRAAHRSALRPSADLYRVSNDARGIFILQRLQDDDDVYFVRTYLRLGVQQQRIMRGWLQAQRPLHDAFVQGYLAAQNPDHANLHQALQAHAEALALLAARYRIAPANASPATDPDDARPDPDDARPDDARPKPPPFDTLTAPPHDTSGLLWSQAALHDLSVLIEQHPATSFDLNDWLWLTPTTVCAHITNLSKSIVDQTRWARIALDGRALAFVTGADAPTHVVRLMATAATLRERLLRHGTTQAPPPDDRAPALQHEHAPRSAASSHHEAHAHGAALPHGLSLDPDGSAAPPEGQLHEASALRVVRWMPQAMRQAEQLDLPLISAAYLDMLDPVPKDALAELLRRLAIRLRPGHHYAARRYRDAVLIVRGEDVHTCAVVHCAAAPPQWQGTAP